MIAAGEQEVAQIGVLVEDTRDDHGKPALDRQIFDHGEGRRGVRAQQMALSARMTASAAS